MEYLQKVNCKGFLKRKEVHLSSNTIDKSKYSKYWYRQFKEFNGVVIGKRTLSDGIAYYQDGPVYYEQIQTFTTYLVSFSMSRNPVYVLPEDIEK